MYTVFCIFQMWRKTSKLNSINNNEVRTWNIEGHWASAFLRCLRGLSILLKRKQHMPTKRTKEKLRILISEWNYRFNLKHSELRNNNSRAKEKTTAILNVRSSRPNTHTCYVLDKLNTGVKVAFMELHQCRLKVSTWTYIYVGRWRFHQKQKTQDKAEK